jgi:hypothetical protein
MTSTTERYRAAASRSAGPVEKTAADGGHQP